MAVVFPFEVDLFERAGLPTTFVGHPLLDGLQPRHSRADFRSWLGIAEQERVLGLLPGSRAQEVQRLLPYMLRTAQRLRQELPDLHAVIARSPDLPAAIYQPFLQEVAAPWLHLAQDDTYSVMAHSDACIVASGTATLETACFQTPMAVVYRVSRLSYAIGKRLVKLKNIGLVNIVAGEEVVPEFVQERFGPEPVAQALLPVLTDPGQAAAVRDKLGAVRAKLGEPGASRRVAELAVRLAWPE